MNIRFVLMLILSFSAFAARDTCKVKVAYSNESIAGFMSVEDFDKAFYFSGNSWTRQQKFEDRDSHYKMNVINKHSRGEYNREIFFNIINKDINEYAKTLGVWFLGRNCTDQFSITSNMDTGIQIVYKSGSAFEWQNALMGQRKTTHVSFYLYDLERLVSRSKITNHAIADSLMSGARDNIFLNFKAESEQRTNLEPYSKAYDNVLLHFSSEN